MGYVPEFDFSDRSKKEFSDACRAAAKGASLPCDLEEIFPWLREEVVLETSLLRSVEGVDVVNAAITEFAIEWMWQARLLVDDCGKRLDLLVTLGDDGNLQVFGPPEDAQKANEACSEVMRSLTAWCVTNGLDILYEGSPMLNVARIACGHPA